MKANNISRYFCVFLIIVTATIARISAQPPQCINYMMDGSVEFSRNAGTKEITIYRKSTNCTYNCLNSASWITVTKTTGNDRIDDKWNITCAANPGGTRSYVIYFDEKRFSVTVTQNGTPAQPGSINASGSFCSNSNVTFSVPAISGATSCSWTVTGGTISSGQGTNSIAVTLGTGSSVQVSVCGINSGVSGPSSSQTYTITTVPSAPNVSNESTCASQGLLKAYSLETIDRHKWYTTSGGDGEVNPTVLTNTTNYYVSSYQAGGGATLYVSALRGGCESPRKEVTATLIPTVGTPGAIMVQASTTEPTCQLTSSLTTTYYTSASNSSGYNWSISNSAAGTIDSSTGVMTWTSDFSGTVDIRVTANGCGGPSAQVARTVNVKSAPSVPGTSYLSRTYNCTSAVIATSEAKTGVTYHWQATSGGMSKANGSNLSVSGNGTYYLRACNTDGCWSVGTTSYVVDKIGVYPSAPGIISPASIYGSGSVTFTISSPNAGYTYNWYNADQTLIGNGTSKTVGLNENSSMSLLVAAQNNESQCTGAFTTTPKVNAYRVPEIASTADKIVRGVGVSLSVNKAINSTPYNSFQWKLNGAGITGATSESYIARSPGNYTVDVFATGASGTKTSAGKALESTVSSQKNMNYITTQTLQDSVKEESEVWELPVGGVQEITQYFDGLGRPIQIVTTAGSPGLSDLIQPIAYDEFGRESIKYLPYTDAVADGSYRTNALNVIYSQSDQYKFYHNGFSNTSAIALDDSAYARTVFEPSPLNRVMQQGAAGVAWQPSTGKAFASDYLTNRANEVKLWKPATDTTFSQASSYAAGELYVTMLTDENQHVTKEYKDKEGHVILKKSYTGKDSLQTYYVYDDFGLLRYVLPPQASATTPTSLAPGNALVKQLCYYYQYDARQRMIVKQLPGADRVYMVYDGRDRLTASQDGNQRKTGEWLFTKYDAFNRPVMSGVFKPAETTREALQTAVNTYYNSSGVNWYTERSNQSTLTNSTGYYLTRSYPESVTETNLRSLTYYDNYDTIPGLKKFAVVSELGATVQNPKVKGLVTATRVKVLDGGNSWITTSIYYDDKYRVIQTVKNNYINGDDRLTTRYDFVGKVMQTRLVHTGLTGKRVDKTFEYDHAGRLVKIFHSVDGTTPVLMSYMKYNELGQLVDKKLHVTDKDNYNTYVQSIDYRYNIRGWLNSINNPGLTNDSGTTNDDTTDKFGMKLMYNVEQPQ